MAIAQPLLRDGEYSTTGYFFTRKISDWNGWLILLTNKEEFHDIET
jgi:hypothetical protein